MKVLNTFTVDRVDRRSTAQVARESDLARIERKIDSLARKLDTLIAAVIEEEQNPIELSLDGTKVPPAREPVDSL